MMIFFVSVAPALAKTTKSTLDDQTSIEVTVYNQNLALIKDARNITLPKGSGELQFMDVAQHIMPVTVHVKSTNEPNKFMVLEQNYEYDLMNYSKLLDKYVGQPIKIIDKNKFQDRSDVVDAVLLSNNNGQAIYKIEDEIYLGHPGIQILPEIPDNLIAKPTLMWLYTNDFQSAHQLEVSYLTRQMSWKADYVLVVGKNDRKGDLSGWVTINNKSGTTYKDATLKLVAGDVNQVRQNQPVREMRMMKATMAMEADASQFQEQQFFEYHIYDLQRLATLKNNQTKQISLLEAKDIGIVKEYIVHGNKYYFTQQYNQQNQKQDVNVYLKFENKKENQLGMPLPKGTVRLYKKDHEDKLQFIGEDAIDHTPKEEEVKLRVGEAFDIVAERKQTDFRRNTTRLYETAWEVTLKNRKEEDVVVSVIEPLHGNWRVISNSHDYEKLDAFTIRFDVPVAKGQEVKVRYRLNVGLK